MKLTALIENRNPDHLIGEHGLSVWIDYYGKVILLDSGSTNRFLLNADRLGLDIAQVDLAVLSHGHYDHSGGFGGFFARNDHAKVYHRAGADGDIWADHPNKGMEYIGIPREVLAKYPDRFVAVEGTAELLPGVWVLPDGVPACAARSRRAGLYRRQGNDFIPDDFCHEQTLVLEGESGLVVLNSCSHAGVPELLQTVLDHFPGRSIAAFFGGFHMMGPQGALTLGWTEEEVLAEAERLRALPVARYYTCHCTGLPAFALLKSALGDRVAYFQTGDCIEL